MSPASVLLEVAGGSQYGRRSFIFAFQNSGGLKRNLEDVGGSHSKEGKGNQLQNSYCKTNSFLAHIQWTNQT
jgi:hypothetical protein